MTETTSFQARRGSVVGSLVLDAGQLRFTPKKKEDGNTTIIPWEKVTKHQSNPPKNAKAMIKVVSGEGETVTFQLKNRDTLGKLQEDIANRISKKKKDATADNDTAKPAENPGPREEDSVTDGEKKKEAAVETAAPAEGEKPEPREEDSVTEGRTKGGDGGGGEDVVDLEMLPTHEMRQKLLDRKEKELAEREAKLEEEKKKLAALMTKLVDVQASIQGLLTGAANTEERRRQSSLSPPPRPRISLMDTSIHEDMVHESYGMIDISSRHEEMNNLPSLSPMMDDSGRYSISNADIYEGMKHSQDLPVDPDVGACYLVYEPDSGGRLTEYYSRTNPVENAIARWSPTTNEDGSPIKKISGFKFKSHGTVIIGSCSGGSQGRKNYFSGWCTFVRTACQMSPTELIMWDPPGKGLNVDVWVYTSDPTPGKQSIKLTPGEPIPTEGLQGVAVLPKKTQFYDDAFAVDLDKWLGEGFDLGGSVRI